MKKILFSISLVLFGSLTLHSQRYSVTFVTESVETDTAFIEGLRRAGYNIHASNLYWRDITDAKVDELNNYDLVIISRATNSANYGDADGDGTMNARWARVTTPVINMSNYIARNNRMQWFDTATLNNVVDSVMLAIDSGHPIFTGIALTENDSSLQLTNGAYVGVEGSMDAGNGKIIAANPANTIAAIVEWDAYTSFYSGTDAPVAHAGKRMWFSGISDPNYFNQNGIKLFKNAVEYIITGKVSDGDDPINSNKVQAESYTNMYGLSVEVNSDTSGLENTVYTENGHWAEYAVDVPFADYYDFKLRYASSMGTDTLRILADGTIIGHVILNGAGGSTDWNTLTIPVYFSASGIKNIRIEAVSNIDTLKINWFDYLDLGLGSSSLVFNTQGKVLEMTIDGMNVLGSTSASTFTLLKFNGKSIESSTSFSCSTAGNTMILTSNTEPLKFTFRINTYPRHFSLHLIDVEGDVSARNYGLKLSLPFNRTMAYKSLSDLLEPYWSSSTNNLTMYWRDLWGQEWDGKRGSVVVWDGTLSGSWLDETLAEVWSTEAKMARPAGQPSWTSSDILHWVDNYAIRFNNMTQIQLEPRSHDELYNMSNEYVIPLGIEQVYLHNNVWREEYWLKKRSLIYVNTDMFPLGEASLKAYVDYLHEHDVTIALHSLSYGIGWEDPEYIVGEVDRRLAKWCSGTLEAPVNASQTHILFRPDSVEMPYLDGSKHTNRCMSFHYMRIGEEIVKVGSFARTEKDVWVLTGCERGFKGTDSDSHDKGVDMAGLFLPYNMNYIPEFDMGQENSLSDELISKYADFVNRMGLDHLHFDGPEIHRKYHPWSSRPMLDASYNRTNRPTTTSSVGGNLDANFELEFSKVKDDLSYNYFPLEIGLRLHDASPAYLSTSFMGTHFHAAECVMLGARRVNLIGVKNSNGITLEALNNHGLADEAVKLFSYYQELAPHIDNNDLNYLKGYLSRRSGSNHYEGDDALILSKNEEGKYIYTPYHVLGFANGSTEPWYIRQEYGAMRRSQFIQTGTTMDMTNPKGMRDLNVIIRVSDASKNIIDPFVNLSDGSIQFTGTLKPNEYLQYESDWTEAIICDKNWKAIGTMAVSKSNFIAPAGALSATVGGSGSPQLEVQLYVKDDPYVLSTNSKLD